MGTVYFGRFNKGTHIYVIDWLREILIFQLFIYSSTFFITI